MKKIGGILAILFGVIFLIVTLNVIFSWLVLLPDTEKDAYGLSFLVSYLIPGVIVASISFLLIRYGMRLLRKK